MLKSRAGVIGSVVGAIALALVGTCWISTVPATSAARTFLASCSNEELAYGMLTESARQRLSFVEFVGLLRRLGLANYESSTWWSRTVSILDGRASLSGNVSVGQDTLFLSMELDREGDGWRVSNLDGHHRELAAPSEEEAKVLVRTTLLALNDAIRLGEHAAIESLLAPSGTASADREKARSVIEGFAEGWVDASWIATAEIRLAERPTVFARDELVLQGTCFDSVRVFQFNIHYSWEASKWCLLKMQDATLR